MSAEFDARYSHNGSPSIPPEWLLRALRLEVFYTIRSERQVMEQLDYNLLFRCSVGRGVDDRVWERTVFCVNRDRLLERMLFRDFFARVLVLADWAGLTSEAAYAKTRQCFCMACPELYACQELCSATYRFY